MDTYIYIYRYILSPVDPAQNRHICVIGRKCSMIFKKDPFLLFCTVSIEKLDIFLQ